MPTRSFSGGTPASIHAVTVRFTLGPVRALLVGGELKCRSFAALRMTGLGEVAVWGRDGFEVEKRVSPLRCAPVEMTVFGAGTGRAAGGGEKVWSGAMKPVWWLQGPVKS